MPDKRTEGLVSDKLAGEGIDESRLTKEAIVDRAVGAIMGALIGNALGTGVHWQYDLDALEKEHGWVTDYVDPKDNPYHGGALKKGELTQEGEMTSCLLRTLAEKGEYDGQHFCAQLDEILKDCDGTRKGGRHGWTNKTVCDLWRRRVGQKKPWGAETASPTTDDTDSIIRAALIAARYHGNLKKMCDLIKEDTRFEYGDAGVLAQSICFGVFVASVINGEALHPNLSSVAYKLAQGGELPFSFLAGTRDDEEDLFEPDGLLLFGSIAGAASNPEIGGKLEKPHKAVALYGRACAWFMALPSTYYLAGAFPSDFEGAVLNSVNAGGQNVARSSLVGALVGAHVGFSNMPERFVEGLVNGREFADLARKVAEDGLPCCSREGSRADFSSRRHDVAEKSRL